MLCVAKAIGLESVPDGEVGDMSLLVEAKVEVSLFAFIGELKLEMFPLSREEG